MAFGYRYTLERQENGWWLVRFPAIIGAALQRQPNVATLARMMLRLGA